MGHHSANCVLVLAIVVVLILLLACWAGKGDDRDPLRRLKGNASRAMDWGQKKLGGLNPHREGMAASVDPSISNCLYGPFDEESVYCSYNWAGKRA